MTDAEKKLCQRIAELEGWRLSKYIDGNGRPYGRRGKNLDSEPLPAYLTDPAELVRMSKELIKNGWWPSYVKDGEGKETWWWHSPSEGSRYTNTCHADKYERVTPEAYKTMREEKG